VGPAQGTRPRTCKLFDDDDEGDDDDDDNNNNNNNNNNNKYQVHGTERKISHLLYMDDLKLLGRNENDLKN